MLIMTACQFKVIHQPCRLSNLCGNTKTRDCANAVSFLSKKTPGLGPGDIHQYGGKLKRQFVERFLWGFIHICHHVRNRVKINLGKINFADG